MNNTVAYIVESQKTGKFRLFMANAVEMQEDNDSILHVTMKGPKFDDAEAAQEALKKDHDAMIAQQITPFYNPIKSSMMGHSWLNELKAANPDVEIL